MYKSKYTRSEIRANREKWIKFLKTKGRKKGFLALDNGDGERCCLGHACYTLGIKPKFLIGEISYDGAVELAPDSAVEMLGLWSSDGSTKHSVPLDVKFKQTQREDPITRLTELNDDTDASPLFIGRYLESVIEGGEHTPFKPLNKYAN